MAGMSATKGCRGEGSTVREERLPHWVLSLWTRVAGDAEGVALREALGLSGFFVITTAKIHTAVIQHRMAKALNGSMDRMAREYTVME